MLTLFLIFAASLAVLLGAARVFTGAAERVGLRLGMSPFAVGVFIVAIGTSLPELVASVLSVRAGSSEIVAGNVLGANAANLLLILGLVSVVVPAGRLVLGEQYLFIDLNFLLGSTVAMGTSMADGRISPVEGAALLAGYVIYVVYLISEGRSASADLAHEEALPGATKSLLRDTLILFASGIAIYLAGERTVDALRELAEALGISPAVAAVTILSIGTTLPEMAVSVIAARRGHASLAFGNILGSCIFNAFAVSGTAALVGGVSVPQRILGFALPFVAAATLLFYVLTQDKRISRWEGLMFLMLFAIFLLEMADLA